MRMENAKHIRTQMRHQKKNSYFPLNPGCLIGILISWFIIILKKLDSINPQLTLTTRGPFFIAQMVVSLMVMNPMVSVHKSPSLWRIGCSSPTELEHSCSSLLKNHGADSMVVFGSCTWRIIPGLVSS